MCHIIYNLSMFFCQSLFSFILHVHKCAGTKGSSEEGFGESMAKDLLDERVEVNTESEQKMENLNVSIIGASLSEPHTYEKHGDLSIYKQCKLYIFTQLCVGITFDVVVLMNVLST